MSHILVLHNIHNKPIYVFFDKIIYFTSYFPLANNYEAENTIVYMVDGKQVRVIETVEFILDSMKAVRRLHLDEFMR